MVRSMKHLKTYESFNNDNFKEWFGDSKMVDKNGQPKKFYHGVGRAGKFDTFDKEFISASSGNHGHFGIGFYFTDSESSAENFSEFFGGTGEVLTVYLKVENPFYVNEESLIKLGEKYDLNLPSKVAMAIDINDLLEKLKPIDPIAHELLYLINKHKDYQKGWKEFLSNHNGEVPESKLDLNTVADWYEDTIAEKYTERVSDYTIEELKEIGIEPKIIYGYDEDIRMDYLTDLGQSATAWTDVIKKEGYDGIVAGDEFVVFEPNQIKSVNNKGTFSLKSDNIYESNRRYKVYEDYIYPANAPKNFDEWLSKGGKFVNNVVPLLEENCSKYLDEFVSYRDTFKEKRLTETDILYRGYKRKYRHDVINKFKVRKDRKPMTTHKLTHEVLGDLFEEEFNWNPRTEGVFATSNKRESNVYGSPFIFLPIGDYKFLYNERIDDLTRHLSNFPKYEFDNEERKDEERLRKELAFLVDGYREDNLQLAIDKKLEVSFKCDEYFLINERFVDFFLEYINNR